MKKRDRRLTPTNTTLVAGWDEAVDREATEVKPDTASAFYLDGEGASENLKSKEDKSKDIARLIPNKDLKIQIYNKVNISKKNDYRVPVLYPDGKPGMPTSNKRANKWIEERNAEVVRNKLNVFAIKLKFWPIYRNTQPTVLCIDPGSSFTGIAVMSKRCILISYMLELPGYKKGSKPFIVTNRHGNKIERYHNTIVDRMTKRRELRKGRRHKNCRRRECRYLNRTKKGKIAPSMLAKKQLELEVVNGLSKLYPITIIGFEDVVFNHWEDKDGAKGQYFSQVEIGKSWLLDRLKKIPNIVEIKNIKGYETAIRREQLKLPKEGDKTKRSIKSHVNDCIAMGSIIHNTLDIPKNKFRFDIVSRPKYSRRVLFAEQPNKDGITERYGGHIPHTSTFKGLRKGDYVEAKAPNLKKIYRGWISGYTDDRIYISDFDWNQSPSFSVDNIRLLDRNHGLVNLRLGWIKDTIDIDSKYNTKQQGIEGDFIKITKEKEIKMKIDKTIQKEIEDAW